MGLWGGGVGLWGGLGRGWEDCGCGGWCCVWVTVIDYVTKRPVNRKRRLDHIVGDSQINNLFLDSSFYTRYISWTALELLM